MVLSFTARCLVVEKKLYEELFPKWPVEPHLTINYWHLGHECQNFYTSLLARPDHALSISLLTMYRQWYKRGLTTYTYNSGHMKMESNRLPEWLGLSTIWICMYCTLIYKTTSYGNHNIKWHVIHRQGNHFWCECKMQDTSPSKFKSLKNSKMKFYGINVERII